MKKIKKSESRREDGAWQKNTETVYVYKAMDNLCNSRHCGLESPALRCARAAEFRVNMTLKGKKINICGLSEHAFCRVDEVKDCTCLGVDPDHPDAVSNCGSYYQAEVVIGTGNQKDNLRKMLEYIKVLEKECGRQAFIKKYESDGLNKPVTFSVMFRIGNQPKIEEYSKPARRAKNKDVK